MDAPASPTLAILESVVAILDAAGADNLLETSVPGIFTA